MYRNRACYPTTSPSYCADTNPRPQAQRPSTRYHCPSVAAPPPSPHPRLRLRPRFLLDHFVHLLRAHWTSSPNSIAWIPQYRAISSSPRAQTATTVISSLAPVPSARLPRPLSARTPSSLAHYKFTSRHRSRDGKRADDGRAKGGAGKGIRQKSEVETEETSHSQSATAKRRSGQGREVETGSAAMSNHGYVSRRTQAATQGLIAFYIRSPHTYPQT
jgi:hypothetical protein